MKKAMRILMIGSMVFAVGCGSKGTLQSVGVLEGSQILESEDATEEGVLEDSKLILEDEPQKPEDKPKDLEENPQVPKDGRQSPEERPQAPVGVGISFDQYVADNILTAAQAEALVQYFEANDPRNGGAIEDPIEGALAEEIITKDQADVIGQASQVGPGQGGPRGGGGPGN